MFEDFYGFTQTPFSRTIPTDKLYRGNDSDELIERLKSAAKRQLFAVMTGDSGTGKTTTLRRFHDELQNSQYQVLYLSDSKMTPDLLQGDFGTTWLCIQALPRRGEAPTP